MAPSSNANSASVSGQPGLGSFESHQTLFHLKQACLDEVTEVPDAPLIVLCGGRLLLHRKQALSAAQDQQREQDDAALHFSVGILRLVQVGGGLGETSVSE